MVFAVFVILLLLLAVLGGQQQEIGQGLVERFLSQTQEPLQQFSATCYVEVKNEQHERSGSMNADAEFHDKTFTFKVVREDGNVIIRHQVLRRALKEEKELWENPDDITFSHKNHFFTPTKKMEGGLQGLLAVSRQDEGFLKENLLFVDASGILVRSRGKLTKNPSFWVRDVVVEMTYGQISGVRVPVYAKFTAKVRFQGSFTLEIWHSYKSVNGTEVTGAR